MAVIPWSKVSALNRVVKKKTRSFYSKNVPEKFPGYCMMMRETLSVIESCESGFSQQNLGQETPRYYKILHAQGDEFLSGPDYVRRWGYTD